MGKTFLIFDADTALAKARASMIHRLAVEEKGRVEAELGEEHKSKAMEETSNGTNKRNGEHSKEQSKKKRKKRKATEGAASDEGKTEGKKNAGSQALSTKDKVEEMDFSSGED